VAWWIDTHYKMKERRDKMAAALNAFKREIEDFEKEALKKFGKEGLEGASGSRAIGFIEERTHVQMGDREEFDKYVKKTGRTELFQGRVSAEAYRELSAQGLKIPGVKTVDMTYFRTRKRG
jgi:hypothetical protein